MSADARTAGWLAGLLEGEGYFGVIRSIKKGKVYLYPRVGVSMTDRDVIERVAAIFGTKIQTVKPAGVSKKTSFRVTLVGMSAARMMTALRPWMGERRTTQIDKALAIHNSKGDPNEARAAWGSAAVKQRRRDELGRLADIA